MHIDSDKKIANPIRFTDYIFDSQPFEKYRIHSFRNMTFIYSMDFYHRQTARQMQSESYEPIIQLQKVPKLEIGNIILCLNGTFSRSTRLVGLSSTFFISVTIIWSGIPGFSISPDDSTEKMKQLDVDLSPPAFV